MHQLAPLAPQVLRQNERPQFNALYVFGDSLSDTGNVFQATEGLQPSSPPYFQGRYSNGQVWVEYLAAKLKLAASPDTNFAYGGAATGSNNGVPSVLTQVEQFTQTHPASRQPLYVIWAGANDYLSGIADPGRPIANLLRAIELLIDAGAENFLVANLPDLGQLPTTRSSASSKALSAVTNAHNSTLRQSLMALNQKFEAQVKLVILDVHTLYQEAIANPSKFGFTNVTSACLIYDQSCTAPEQFLFWDSIHPTTATHRILAETAFAAIEAAN